MITSLTDKVIRLEAVSKQYPLANLGDFWALQEISLDVHQGEILGIIGRNGAGKTTLLNIIAGTISPTQGEVNITGKALGLFNLGIGFQDELTGRENIFLNGAILGAGRGELENKFASILEFSELGSFIHQPLGSYSQGMRLRLGFSIVANLDFDILAIDEVLAVGDILFQNKCFQKLLEFRRQGKTLLITNQSMDLIERLSDQVALLDHGKLLFYGNPQEGINKYRKLLATEHFFVGPIHKNIKIFEHTKKWADDITGWGRRLGTKEVIIEKIELKNKFGWNCSEIKSQEPLKIKVYFRVRNTIKEPHFGIAIFRNDGVYCYGPNTAFEEYQIPELKEGKGYFILDYPRLMLAGGEYRISVAIWDKNETIAFDYHDGCYKLTIKGKDNFRKGLLNIPVKNSFRRGINFKPKIRFCPDPNILKDKWGQKIDSAGIEIGSVKLVDSLNETKEVFITNEPVKILINFNRLAHYDRNCLLWVGLFREDGIYCQGITQEFNQDRYFEIAFPKLALLPGGYRISVGIWNSRLDKFIACDHAIYPFRMIFYQGDHGTVYLEHHWKWRLP